MRMHTQRFILATAVVAQESTLLADEAQMESRPAWNRRPSYGGSAPAAPAAPTNMAAYNDRYGVCIDASSFAQLANGEMCPVGRLRKGDRVAGPDGAVAQVQCLVQTACASGRAWLAALPGGARVTPYHPVHVGDKWCFPVEVADVSEVPCQAVCSFVVEGAPAVLLQGGVAAVALGHGLAEGAAEHPYFGGAPGPTNIRPVDPIEFGGLRKQVSHGIYLSIAAAGVHRSMGVRTSFVQSTALDAWRPLHLRMMELGGNRRFRDFLREQGVPEGAPLREKYATRAAAWYRRTGLRAEAEGSAPPEPLAAGVGHLPEEPCPASAVLDGVFAEARAHVSPRGDGGSAPRPAPRAQSTRSLPELASPVSGGGGGMGKLVCDGLTFAVRLAGMAGRRGPGRAAGGDGTRAPRGARRCPARPLDGPTRTGPPAQAACGPGAPARARGRRPPPLSARQRGQPAARRSPDLSGRSLYRRSSHSKSATR
ncbi:unnamed protein product [Prorocentrum cordatum]|uniref:Arf-GAP domain-containing protein n=1 Tax=Prorocentrum cordatum TaxID=2364126 RepID=A0ABN9SF75_9DINO|nr:unnamed protein product [Polarella glacialis]